MQLRLNYSVNRNGFFAATTMANRTQKVLLEEINDLRDRVNKLESTLDRQQVSDEIKTNVAKSLERFKNTHRSLQFPVFNSGSVDEKNANSHTAEGNLTELEERIAKLFTTEPPASATSTTTQALH